MRYQRLLGWITILIISLGLQAGNPQDGEALVCTDPARLEIGAGQIKIMRILLVNAQNVYGIDLQATFDPAVVEVVDADSKKTGVQMISGDFLKPDFTILNTADNTAGTLRYVVTQLAPTHPANGKGTFLLIQFRGKVVGTSSKLTFTSTVIADRAGNKLPITIQAADLVIVRPKTPTPTPLSTTYLLPAAPTWAGATLTSTRSQPSAQPSTTATRKNPSAQPSATANQHDHAWIPERGPAGSDQILTYIAVGGFSGAILLSGLSIWLRAAKRRKERIAKSK